MNRKMVSSITDTLENLRPFNFSFNITSLINNLKNTIFLPFFNLNPRDSILKIHSSDIVFFECIQKNTKENSETALFDCEITTPTSTIFCICKRFFAHNIQDLKNAHREFDIYNTLSKTEKKIFLKCFAIDFLENLNTSKFYEYEFGIFIEKCDCTLKDLILYNSNKTENLKIPSNLVAKNFLDDEKLLLELKKIVEGFCQLNQLGIYHSDVKPSNIFLKNKEFKIGDFDVSVNESNKTEDFNKNMVRNIRGTKDYFAPELFYAYTRSNFMKNRRIIYDVCKTDVFSLGVSILEYCGTDIFGINDCKLLGNQMICEFSDKEIEILDRVFIKGKIIDNPDEQEILISRITRKQEFIDRIIDQISQDWIKNLLKNMLKFFHHERYHFFDVLKDLYQIDLKQSIL